MSENNNIDQESDPLGVLVALGCFVVLWCWVAVERARNWVKGGR